MKEIDWLLICNKLRAIKPLSKIARDIGCEGTMLRRLATGIIKEPKYSTGVKILEIYKGIS